MSPTALRFLKAAMNADTDGLAGLQQMAGDATLLYYTTDEAKKVATHSKKTSTRFWSIPKIPLINRGFKARIFWRYELLYVEKIGG